MDTSSVTPADVAPAFHPPAPLDDSRNTDGWTADRQRQFLIAIAHGVSVTRACAMVGLTRQSAYALRDSARGAAFALGWRAAMLRSRDALADTLMDRAFNGVRETVTHDDGAMTTRHRYDNALAYRMLVRLDRRADAALATGSPRAAQRPAATAGGGGCRRPPGRRRFRTISRSGSGSCRARSRRPVRRRAHRRRRGRRARRAGGGAHARPRRSLAAHPDGCRRGRARRRSRSRRPRRLDGGSMAAGRGGGPDRARARSVDS
ncbi:hypothetical protein ACPVPU_11690 [Sphingomonas sp. CJ99]